MHAAPCDLRPTIPRGMPQSRRYCGNPARTPRSAAVALLGCGPCAVNTTNVVFHLTLARSIPTRVPSPPRDPAGCESCSCRPASGPGRCIRPLASHQRRGPLRLQSPDDRADGVVLAQPRPDRQLQGCHDRLQRAGRCRWRRLRWNDVLVHPWPPPDHFGPGTVAPAAGRYPLARPDAHRRCPHARACSSPSPFPHRNHSSPMAPPAWSRMARAAAP